jgi:hypothetical protein
MGTSNPLSACRCDHSDQNGGLQPSRHHAQQSNTAPAAAARLQELRGASRDLVIVALTRSKSRAEKLTAQEAGAGEFFQAPVDAHLLRVVLERAISKRLVEIEGGELREQLVHKYTFGSLIGGCETLFSTWPRFRAWIRVGLES